jgi:hypothetical protein
MLNTKQFVPVLGLVLGVVMATTVTAKSAEKVKARSYEVSVTAPMKVGTQLLKPGDYKVKLDGSNAVFTRENGKVTITTPAKMVSGAERYGMTMMHEVQDGDDRRVTGIELKGTQDLMEFE